MFFPEGKASPVFFLSLLCCIVAQGGIGTAIVGVVDLVIVAELGR